MYFMKIIYLKFLLDSQVIGMKTTPYCPQNGFQGFEHTPFGQLFFGSWIDGKSKWSHLSLLQMAV